MDEITDSANLKLRDVERFWSANPCNSSLGSARDRRAWFLEIESDRYSNESHIPKLACFESFANKDVLEIGCGIGTDGRRFVAAGARYVGVNLDRGSSLYSKEAMELFCLPGNIIQMNAEQLAFQDETFDHVYSFGVIHHSPNPGRIISGIYKVLRPGGTTTIMLYNRCSINYYIEIMFLRKLFRFALVPNCSPKYLSKLFGLERHKLERHRQIFLSETMSHERWVSINTDGPDCPLARVYSKKEAVELLERAGFEQIQPHIDFFDKRHYGRIGKLIPDLLLSFLGKRYGWHLTLKARKPLRCGSK